MGSLLPAILSMGSLQGNSSLCLVLQDWQNHPDVLYARALVQKGQKVTCVTDGMPTWVCELMVVKPSVEEAITFVKAIDQALDIPIV